MDAVLQFFVNKSMYFNNFVLQIVHFIVLLYIFCWTAKENWKPMIYTLVSKVGLGG